MTRFGRALRLEAAVITFVILGALQPAWAGPFDWLSPDWWRPQPVTVYAPVVTTGVTRVYSPVVTSSPVAASVTTVVPTTAVAYSPVTQTCYYAPETRYRWVYGRMPVTTYRPVNIVDPLTGTTTTTYAPQTRLTLLPWLHREPYTTYRLVCTPTVPVAVSETSYVIADPCAPIGEVFSPTFSAPATSCPPGCVPAPSMSTLPGPTEAPPSTAPPSTDSGYSAPQTFKGGGGPSAGMSTPYSVQRPAENGTNVPPGGTVPRIQNGNSSVLPPAVNQPQILQPSSKSAEWYRGESPPRLAQQVSFDRANAAASVSPQGQGGVWTSTVPAVPPRQLPATDISADGWRPARP